MKTPKIIWKKRVDKVSYKWSIDGEVIYEICDVFCSDGDNDGDGCFVLPFKVLYH